MKRVKEMARLGVRPDPTQFDDLPRTWRVRYLLYRHGHRIAYVMLGLGCLLALAWSATLYTRVGDQADQLEDQQRTMQDQQRTTQIGREATANEVCGALNANSLANRQQATYLQGLILGGAKSSKAFENIYRQYGAPPYKQRLAQAKEQADGLNGTLPPVIDCKAMRERIRREILRPARRPPVSRTPRP